MSSGHLGLVWETLKLVDYRDQARGRNFALNGTQGEVGLPKKKIFFFFL